MSSSSSSTAIIYHDLTVSSIVMTLQCHLNHLLSWLQCHQHHPLSWPDTVIRIILWSSSSSACSYDPYLYHDHFLISSRPPAQAAVLFKHEPKLAAAFTRAEENWKRRKSKQTEPQTLQLVSAWSESTTQVDPIQQTTPSIQEGKPNTKGTTEYISKINLETIPTSKTSS